jgi:hypothetical protein
VLCIPFRRVQLQKGGTSPMKKLQVRKTGPVRLTSVMMPMYSVKCIT